MAVDLRDLLGCYAVELTQGRWALVSPQDIERVMQHTWCHRGRGYASSEINGTLENLHAFIMQPEPGMWVDHINRNPLDCRRENMRLCTPAQNNLNKPTRATSGHRYVRYDSVRDCYEVRLSKSMRPCYVGRYDTLAEAIEARDNRIRERHRDMLAYYPHG